VGRQHNPFELVMRVGFAKKNSDKNGPKQRRKKLSFTR
jgi:hypothetical protein